MRSVSMMILHLSLNVRTRSKRKQEVTSSSKGFSDATGEKMHLESSDDGVHSSEVRSFFFAAAEPLCRPLSACVNHTQGSQQGHTFISQSQSETDSVWFLTLDLLRCSLETCMRETGGETDETLNVSPVEVMPGHLSDLALLGVARGGEDGGHGVGPQLDELPAAVDVMLLEVVDAEH